MRGSAFRVHVKKGGTVAHVQLPQDLVLALIRVSLADGERKTALAIAFAQYQFAAESDGAHAITLDQFAQLVPRRTVARALPKLEALGIIHIDHGGGRGVVNKYSIEPPERWHWTGQETVPRTAPNVTEGNDPETDGSRMVPEETVPSTARIPAGNSATSDRKQCHSGQETVPVASSASDRIKHRQALPSTTSQADQPPPPPIMGERPSASSGRAAAGELDDLRPGYLTVLVDMVRAGEEHRIPERYRHLLPALTEQANRLAAEARAS